MPTKRRAKKKNKRAIKQQKSGKVEKQKPEKIEYQPKLTNRTQSKSRAQNKSNDQNKTKEQQKQQEKPLVKDIIDLSNNNGQHQDCQIQKGFPALSTFNHQEGILTHCH
ncbi:unnamed protein product [Paramecium sonneborni]|uniref:Uncharacterized protein n=1 Tax=Paramecium sonneborni TaxID=65129 RepID=A0A8S1RG04_9CILI|nr:unnamed protein product [Paramecium sonneborni]